MLTEEAIQLIFRPTYTQCQYAVLNRINVWVDCGKRGTRIDGTWLCKRHADKMAKAVR